jgi:hypothetical protein
MTQRPYTRVEESITLRPTAGAFRSLEDLGASIAFNAGPCSTFSVDFRDKAETERMMKLMIGEVSDAGKRKAYLSELERLLRVE